MFSFDAFFTFDAGGRIELVLGRYGGVRIPLSMRLPALENNVSFSGECVFGWVLTR